MYRVILTDPHQFFNIAFAIDVLPRIGETLHLTASNGDSIHLCVDKIEYIFQYGCVYMTVCDSGFDEITEMDGFQLFMALELREMILENRFKWEPLPNSRSFII